jgi:hypothetical protein
MELKKAITLKDKSVVNSSGYSAPEKLAIIEYDNLENRVY